LWRRYVTCLPWDLPARSVAPSVALRSDCHRPAHPSLVEHVLGLIVLFPDLAPAAANKQYAVASWVGASIAVLLAGDRLFRLSLYLHPTEAAEVGGGQQQSSYCQPAFEPKLFQYCAARPAAVQFRNRFSEPPRQSGIRKLGRTLETE